MESQDVRNMKEERRLRYLELIKYLLYEDSRYDKDEKNEILMRLAEYI